MNYFTLIEDIKRTSLQFAEEFYEGDVYEFLNSGNHKYPSIILTTQNVSTTDNINSISGTLFCVDRLTDDSSNRLEIQSNAFNKLQRIISALEENTINLQSNTYTPFTEKFSDLCGGMFVEFNLQYVGESLCDDLEIKEIELTQNGIYDVIGYDRAIVNVRPVVNLEDITITDNGEYTCGEGFDGFGKVNVDLRGVFDVTKILGYAIPQDPVYNTQSSGTKVNIIIDGDFLVIPNCSYGLEINDEFDFNRITKAQRLFYSNIFRKGINYSFDKIKFDSINEFYQVFYSANQTDGAIIDLTTWDFTNTALSNGYLIRQMFGINIKDIVGYRTIDDIINNNICVLKGLRSNPVIQVAGSLNRESLRAIINGLADMSEYSPQTLQLHTSAKAKLTEEDIAIAVGKNWSIA